MWSRDLIRVALAASFASIVGFSSADEPHSTVELAQRIVAAHGGPEQLLSTFRMKEQYTSGEVAKSPGTPRESVYRAPDRWWIGTKERGAEPGKVATWAWTLRILDDSRSQLESLPALQDGDQSLRGLRITGSVDPPLDLYCDATTYRLTRIDWRNDIYRFSVWKEQQGLTYSTRCVLYRRNTGAAWFHHEILELEPLQQLPEGLGP